MNERTNERTNGWMDGWMNEPIRPLTIHPLSHLPRVCATCHSNQSVGGVQRAYKCENRVGAVEKFACFVPACNATP